MRLVWSEVKACEPGLEPFGGAARACVGAADADPAADMAVED